MIVSRYRSDTWKMLRTGAAVQAAMLISMVVQNLLIPRILGVEKYGVVVGMLAPLNLMSGLGEPLFATLFLRYREDMSGSAAATLFKGLLVCALCAPIAIAGAFAIGEQHSKIYSLSFGEYGLISAIAVLLLVNAVLLAAALATLGGARLAACYLGQAISTLCSIPLAFYFGLTGVLLLYVANLLTVTVILLAFGEAPRKLVTTAVRQALSSSEMPGVSATAKAFLAAIAPRSVIVLLNVVSVLVATLYMEARDLAMYRMAITLLTATLYLVPISPPVLLEFFSRGDAGSGQTRAARNILLSLAVAGSLLGIFFIVFSNVIFSFIFGEPVAVPPSLSLVFASTPFFLLIPSFSTVLLAMRRDSALSILLFITSTVFAMMFVVGNINAAFFAACAVFTAGSTVAMRRASQ